MFHITDTAQPQMFGGDCLNQAFAVALALEKQGLRIRSVEICSLV